MTPKQSLPRKQSLIRRSLAVLGAALLTAAWTVGVSIPANAAAAKALEIVSVTNTTEPRLGLLVQSPQEFEVEVRVVNNAGRTTTVSEETVITLTASGPGTLEGENGTNATIEANESGETIRDLTYSPFDNDVVLTVSVQSGADLSADEISVDFARTATGANATAGASLVVTDDACVAPTPEVPICSQLLLPNGAINELDERFDVVLSIGSCDDLGPCRTANGITALVATGAFNVAELYDKTSPATMIIACDKVLCGGTGVPKLDVIFTLDNDGPLNQTASECPRKGVIGPDPQKVCVDYVSSMRSDGDLYLHLLFDDDMRGSM